jgi:hypothetical protein
VSCIAQFTSRIHTLTFTTNGVVDEETQKNYLDVREVLNVTKEVPIERAYDSALQRKQTAS